MLVSKIHLLTRSFHKWIWIKYLTLIHSLRLVTPGDGRNDPAENCYPTLLLVPYITMQADIVALSLPRKIVDELLWLSTFFSMKHLSNVSSTDTMSGIRNMGSSYIFSLFFLFSLYGIKLCPLKARSSGMWVGLLSLFGSTISYIYIQRN